MTVINNKIIIQEIKKNIEEKKQEEKKELEQLKRACDAYKVYTKGKNNTYFQACR